MLSDCESDNIECGRKCCSICLSDCQCQHCSYNEEKADPDLQITDLLDITDKEGYRQDIFDNCKNIPGIQTVNIYIY